MMSIIPMSVEEEVGIGSGMGDSVSVAASGVSGMSG